MSVPFVVRTKTKRPEPFEGLGSHFEVGVWLRLQTRVGATTRARDTVEANHEGAILHDEWAVGSRQSAGEEAGRRAAASCKLPTANCLLVQCATTAPLAAPR